MKISTTYNQFIVVVIPSKHTRYLYNSNFFVVDYVQSCTNGIMGSKGRCYFSENRRRIQNIGLFVCIKHVIYLYDMSSFFHFNVDILIFFRFFFLCCCFCCRFEKDNFKFTGYPLDLSKVYKVTMNFKKDIDPEKVKGMKQGRYHDFVIFKAEKGYWPTLLRDGKPHWLKVDFERWKDEDSDGDEGKDLL